MPVVETDLKLDEGRTWMSLWGLTCHEKIRLRGCGEHGFPQVKPTARLRNLDLVRGDFEGGQGVLPLLKGGSVDNRRRGVAGFRECVDFNCSAGIEELIVDERVHASGLRGETTCGDC
jgi:hypothetical protein